MQVNDGKMRFTKLSFFSKWILIETHSENRRDFIRSDDSEFQMHS